MRLQASCAAAALHLLAAAGTASAATCVLGEIYNATTQCNSLCCGKSNCNCVQATVVNSSAGLFHDAFRYCEYVECVFEAIRGCHDEIAEYKFVEMNWNWVAVEHFQTSADGRPLSRHQYCMEKWPCPRQSFEKLNQCIAVQKCRTPWENVTARCSEECVESVANCVRLSCPQRFPNRRECQSYQAEHGDCSGLCGQLFGGDAEDGPPATPPADPMRDSLGSDETPALVVGALTGVGMGAGFGGCAVLCWLWRRKRDGGGASIAGAERCFAEKPSEPSPPVFRQADHTPPATPETAPSRPPATDPNDRSLLSQTAGGTREQVPLLHMTADGPSLPGASDSVPRPAMKRHNSGAAPVSSSEGEASEDGRFGSSFAMVSALRAGQWQRGQLLGRGQFGSVFLALLGSGQALAVKRLDASSVNGDVAERVLREIRLMRSLQHPNIVRYVFAAFEQSESRINIFMEYVGGGTLARLVKAMQTYLGESQAQMYMRQVLQGLDFLHRHRIVHRDIKGDNVLVDTSLGVCKITDFGSSKQLLGASGDGRAQTLAGTPNWMAPEVITNKICAELAHFVDVWSIGCTAVEILNRGKPPWPEFASQWAAIFHIANSKGPPEGIPDHLSEPCRLFVLRCLQHDPSDRPTVAECLTDPWISESLSVTSGPEDCCDDHDVDETIREMLSGKRRPPAKVVRAPSESSWHTDPPSDDDDDAAAAAGDRVRAPAAAAAAWETAVVQVPGPSAAAEAPEPRPLVRPSVSSTGGPDASDIECVHLSVRTPHVATPA